MNELGDLIFWAQDGLVAGFAVFLRVGAAMSLMPGFGEQALPTRIKLVAALCFTLIVLPTINPAEIPSTSLVEQFAVLILSETLIGLMIGLAARIMIMALQFAGTIASQSTSLAQIFGAGATPDPMPAFGNILLVAGIALAFTLDLHIKIAISLIQSFETMPLGVAIRGSDLATWGTAHASGAFALAFTLAAPFLITSLAYNLALGAINKAMPQLMVAFIGAPAITAAGVLLLFLSAPLILIVWTDRLDVVLDNPFGVPR